MLRILATVLILSLAATAPALADQAKGKGKGNAGGNVIERTTEGIVEDVVAGVIVAVLSDDERRIINSYFHDHAGEFGKVKPLPPGIRQKLARGGAMPPTAKHTTSSAPTWSSSILPPRSSSTC